MRLIGIFVRQHRQTDDWTTIEAKNTAVINIHTFRKDDLSLTLHFDMSQQTGFGTIAQPDFHECIGNLFANFVVAIAD